MTVVGWAVYLVKEMPQSIDRAVSKAMNKRAGRLYLPAYYFRYRATFPIVICALALLLTGCVTMADPEASQEYRTEVIAVIGPGESIGQSFISRRPRLNSVTVWLSLLPGEASDAENTPAILTAKLYSSPSQLRLSQTVSIITAGAQAITFDPQPDLPGQAYIIELKDPSRPVQVLGRGEDAYTNGQANLNSSPIDADMAFRTGYQYGWQAIMQDLASVPSQAGSLLALVLVIFLPGWLVLDTLGLRARFTVGEQAALALGLSLSLIPLVMLWTTTLGIAWDRTAVFGATGLLISITLWRIWYRWQKKKSSGYPTPNLTGADSIHLLLLLTVTALALGVRLAMVRDLVAPAWVDSVHHALITRLITEQGMFPQSYAPFLALDTAYYHAGFHSLVAAFHWLSGMDIPDAMLLLGQILNGLAPLSVYFLALTLLNDRKAGLAAALVTAVFTPMPTYYASWGRYTQLAGLIILPAAFALLNKLLKGYLRRSTPIPDGSALQSPERPDNFLQREWKMILCGGISLAGLFLVHYRVAAFLVCLVLASEASQVRFERSALTTLFRRILWVSGAIGVSSLALTLPWLWPATQTLFLPFLKASGESLPRAFYDFSWTYLDAALGRYTLYLAGVGLIWGAIKGQRFVIALGLWVALLFLLANLGALSLPFGVYINNTSVEITMFMPISVAIGYLASTVYSASSKIPWPPLRRTALVTLALGISILAFTGTSRLLTILNPATLLIRQGDRDAMAWISEYIPEEATLLINPFHWGYGLFAGQDGGFWISPLAGRKTVPPPVLYGMGKQQDVQEINEIAQMAIQYGENPVELASHMEAYGIQYVYIGVRPGPLSPRALRGSPYFEELYSEGGVSIFRVLRLKVGEQTIKP